MKIPEYALDTFADLLERRISMQEDWMLVLMENIEGAPLKEYKKSIKDAKAYYRAMVSQLNAQASK